MPHYNLFVTTRLRCSPASRAGSLPRGTRGDPKDRRVELRYSHEVVGEDRLVHRQYGIYVGMVMYGSPFRKKRKRKLKVKS